MRGPYDDIIHLTHHVSATRPQMSRENRAAQFSPFAALTGYDAAIGETARLTDERTELGEDIISALNMRLSILANIIASRPEVSVTYFRPDTKKAGGVYITVMGAIKKIDDNEHVLVFTSGEKIKIEDILNIECELFGYFCGFPDYR